MSARLPHFVAPAVALLMLAAAAALVSEHRAAARRGEVRREFQQLVGGLGFGPAVDLSTCPFAFDPRLARDCQNRHSPFAGADRFCPHHGCSVFVVRPPQRGFAADQNLEP